jgi:hypothetical protein
LGVLITSSVLHDWGFWISEVLKLSRVLHDCVLRAKANFLTWYRESFPVHTNQLVERLLDNYPTRCRFLGDFEYKRAKRQYTRQYAVHALAYTLLQQQTTATSCVPHQLLDTYSSRLPRRIVSGLHPTFDVRRSTHTMQS